MQSGARVQSIRYLTTQSVHTDLIGFVLGALILAGTAAILLAQPGVLLQAMAVAGLIAVVVRQGAIRHTPAARFGPGDRITLLRAAGVAALAGLPFQTALADTGLWVVVAVSGLLLLLDGVDGAVARRTGTSSTFGARFDMELDAFFILVLCLLLWQAGMSGIWVLLIGLLRYLFLGAGLLLPALRAPLPDSLRRKTACVAQILALLLGLAPLTSAGQAGAILLAALALLVYSFAVDTRWLLRNAAGRDA